VIGFTGTSRGMTVNQRATVGRILLRLHKGGKQEFHHGDEPHSDREAAKLAKAIGYKVIPHPGGDAEQNIRRNHEIVDISRIMIAAPSGDREVLRSGTWATVRYALGKLKKKPLGGPRPMFTVWPDGSYDTYNFDTRPEI
jgi:hypothetical protein